MSTLRLVTQTTGAESGASPAAALVNNERTLVCLNSLSNVRPRREFLPAETFFEMEANKIRTQAYLDTLASYLFISEKLIHELQSTNPFGVTWKNTGDTMQFTVGVGQQVHTAPVVQATFTIDGFRGQVPFAVAPLETFDCILVGTFSEPPDGLKEQRWHEAHYVWRPPVHRIHKVGLILPICKARKAVQDPGCLLLMIQPLDPRPEIIDEEAHLDHMRTKVSDEWELDHSDQYRLDRLINHRYKGLFEPLTQLPPER
eukprot:scaffold3034_cov1150-Pavlova_lutheri.AAC.1